MQTIHVTLFALAAILLAMFVGDMRVLLLSEIAVPAFFVLVASAE